MIDGKLYVAGGANGSDQHIATLQIFDPSQDSWTTGDPVPTEVWNGVGGVIDGLFYLTGGADASGIISSSLWIYDPTLDSWSSGAAMPEPRIGATSEVLNGRMYVIGGLSVVGSGGTADPESTVFEYDPTGNSWMTKAPIPTPRSSAASGVLDGKIHIAGGWHYNLGGLQSVMEAYDPLSDSWVNTGKDLQFPVTNALGLVVSGRFYVIGGKSGTYVANGEMFDPYTQTWYSKASMTFERGSMAGGTIDGRLYVAGGLNGTSLSDVEAYFPQYYLKAQLGSGQSLPETQVTLTATTISDYLDNTASLLDTTFTPTPADTVRPTIAVYQPTGTQSGNVTIPYVLTDPDSSEIGFLAEYSTNTGTTWLAASVSSDTSNIVSADYDSSLVWQSGTDLADQELSSVWFRITPYDTQGWGTADTTLIDTDNQAPQWVNTEVAWGDSTFTFWFNESVVETTATNPSNISISGGLTVASAIAKATWSTGDTMSHPRFEAAYGVINGQLYVAGGTSDYNAAQSTLETYLPQTGSWYQKSPMQTARFSAASAVIEDKLYVAGGYNGSGGDTYYAVLESWDFATDTWSTLAPMPTPRHQATAVALNGKLYVAGGEQQSGYIDSLYVYDPKIDEWEVKAPMQASRLFASAGTYGGKIYVIGGSPTQSTVEIYDPKTNNWSYGSAMPTARSMASLVTFDNRFYVFGGWSGSGYLDALEVYDPETDSWAITGSMPFSRGRMASGIVDDTIYFAGGWDNSAVSISALEILELQHHFQADLGQGQTFSENPLTLSFSNLSDIYGNLVTGSLDTTYNFSDQSRPRIAVYQPTGTQVGDVTIPFVISDSDNSAVGLLAEYSKNSGTTWSAASVSGDTSGIAQADYDSSLIWQSVSDLPDQQMLSVWFRLRPHDTVGWGTADTTLIDIDNQAAQWINAEGTSGDSTFTFWFNELVADTSATNNGNFSLTGGLTTGSISGSDDDSWATRTPAPTPRNAAMAGVIDGLLYIAGGLDGGTNNALEAYDPLTDSWTTKTSMPTGRRSAAAGVIDGKFYVAGGNVGGFTFALEVYDPSTNSWTTMTSTPTARERAEAGVIDGRLYIVGGVESSAAVATLEIYDPSTDSWTTATPMLTARQDPVVGVIDGKLYVAGGGNGSTDLATLEVYDPATDSWTTKTSMPTARQDAAGGVIDGKLYVAGGEISGGALNTLEVYDTATDSWAVKSYLPIAISWATGGVINGRLYIMGGGGGELYEYTALPTRYELTLTSGQTLSSAEPPVTLTATNIVDLYSNIAASLDMTFTPADPNRPSVTLWQPAGIQSGDITVPYTISDPEGGTVGLLAEFSTDDGSTWQAASVSSDTSGIALADHDSSLVWQSRSDLPDQDLTYGVQFRLTPHDPGGWGTADITLVDIDNLAPQGFSASGTAGDSTITFWFDELADEDTATNTSNFTLTGGLTVGSIIGHSVDEWSVLSAMPSRRDHAVAGVINGKLYIAGGEDSGNNYTSTLYEYDPAIDTWATKTSMPTMRGWAVAGVIDGKLYVAGGTNSTEPLSKLEVYDPSTNSWTTKTSMPTYFIHSVAGVIDGKLYVAGNQDGASQPLGDVIVYNPSTDSWSTLASMPTARKHAVAGVIDGKLYVAGGQTTGDVFASSLDAYNPSTDSWITLAPIPTTRSNAAAAVIDGQFYVVGGFNDSGPVAEMEVYDPVANTWTPQTPMPNQEAHAVAGGIDGVFYIAGGESNDSVTMEAYTALPPRFELTLTSGQALPDSSTQVTLTASNISDIYGNAIATALDTTFKPYFYDPTRPEISIYGPSETQGGDITVDYLISDTENSPIGLLAEYSTDAGGTWLPASVSGDTSNIASDAYDNSLVWQSGTNLPSQVVYDAWFRLTPHDPGGWGTSDTSLVDIDNLAPQWVDARAVAGSDSFEFWFDEPVVDARAMNTGNITITGLTIDTIEKVPNWVIEEPNLIWRHGHGAVTVGRKIYLIGGWGADGTYTHNSIEIFDLDTGQWELRSGYPIDLTGAWAVAVGNTIYAGGYSDTFYKYHIDTDTWTELTATADIGMSAAVVIDGLIYVAGGTGMSGEVGHLRIFNPTSETWSFGSSMMEARHSAGHGVIDGKFYVAGGDNASGQMTSVEVYTPSTDTWEYISPLPSPEGSAAGWTLGDTLYVAGGDTLWVYDASIDTWSAVGRTPQDRVQHAITVFEGRAYTSGGHFAGSQTTQVDSYDPINRYRAFLTTGQAMPFSSVNVTASNIDDPYGNSAGILSVDFTPSDTNDDPTITLDPIDTEVSGDVSIGYTLTDIEGDPIDLSPRYSLDGGSTWSVMTTDSDTSGITSDSYTGTILWQSSVDEPGLDNESVKVRVHAIDNAIETGNFDTITFHVDNNDLPEMIITSKAYSATDTSWTVQYTLSDTESDTLSIDAEYSLDAGATWVPAAVTGDTSGIAAANYSGSLVWHVGRNVPSPDAGSMLLRLTPRDNDPGTSDEVPLAPWNDHAPHVVLSTPVAGEQSGNVTIDFQITDLDDSIVGLLAEYFSTGEVWEPATVTVSGDTTSLGGTDYTGSFMWNSVADLAGKDIDSVMVRVTPHDTEIGHSDTLKIHIDNNVLPGLNGHGTSGTARDITLNFTLTDTENDTLRFWSFYSIDSRATWHLMTLVEDLSEILPGQYPSSATWRSFDDIGYARYDTAYVNLYAADRDTVGPAATDYIENLVNYVGDYSGDTTIDFSDFATLTTAWNEQNSYHDIGPATGTPPDLVPAPDGVIDFEDLAVFSIMWNALSSGQSNLLADEHTGGLIRPGASTSSVDVDEHPVIVQPGEPDDVWQQDDGMVTWNIEAREIAGLSAAHLVLQYDPTQLYFLELTPGSFLGVVNGREQSLIHLKRVDPQAGILELMLGRIDSEDPDVDGSGILAVVRFREIVTAEHSFTIAYDLRDRSTDVLAAGRYDARVASTRLPGEFALLQNYPNPFNGQTTIRFQLPSRQKVSLYLFNVRGQLVRTLLDEEMEPGYHKVTWDGRTEGGQTVASGIYIYLIQAGRNKQSLKLTLIK